MSTNTVHLHYTQQTLCQHIVLYISVDMSKKNTDAMKNQSLLKSISSIDLTSSNSIQAVAQKQYTVVVQ